MEADWEVEIAPDAPVIDGAWAGLVDLRHIPERVNEIGEVVELSALTDVLLRLNSADSPVWTAKCDFWAVEEFDPDEMAVEPGEARVAIACYLDLLPTDDRAWRTLDEIADWSRQMSKTLQ